MNEGLRLLDRALKKFGWAIKKHPQYNLLPLKNFSGFGDLKNTYESIELKNKPGVDNLGDLDVCLRTCISNKRTHGKQNDLNNLTQLSLDQHLLKCIKSLIISINDALKKGHNITLTIFDDRSDEIFLNKIEDLCRGGSKCEYTIKQTGEPGQGASLHEHFSYAKNKNKLFYFCEDDYLHTTTAIDEMLVFYKAVYTQAGSHILIYPQEHDLLYNEQSYPSYILTGEHRRWRTISHATHTFFTHSNVVEQYWDYFENTKYVGNRKKRRLGSEKNTTNRLFNHIPGFSPIPAVAVHFQSKDCLPPFFDWRSILDGL